MQSTLTYCLSGKTHARGELCGSSGGPPGGGSLLPGRFNYSVLSRRSYRNANNNNSLSSGNSLVDGDLTRRPLVVSFKKRNCGRTSTSSLEPSPDKKGTYLETPRGNYHSDGPIELGSSFLSPRNLRVPTNYYHDTSISFAVSSARPQSKESSKIPRIEDIEIFQESQLKISRRVPKDPVSDSPTVYVDSNTKLVLQSGGSDGVKKSHTEPCLRISSS